MTTPEYRFTIQELYDRFPESHEIITYFQENAYEEILTEYITLGDVAIHFGPAAAYWCARILPIEANKQIITAIHRAVEPVAIKSSSIELMGVSNLINSWIYDALYTKNISEIMDDVSTKFVSGQSRSRSIQKYSAKAIIETFRIIKNLEEQKWQPELFSHVWVFIICAVSAGKMNRISFRHGQIAKICELFPPVLKVSLEADTVVSNLISISVLDKTLQIKASS